VSNPYSNPTQHDREQAEIELAAWRERDRFTPPAEPMPPLLYREPPSVRWRWITQQLVEFRQTMRDIATRTDGTFGSYNADQREFCRSMAAMVGPEIGEAMGQVTRHNEVCAAAGKEALERQERFFNRLAVQGRLKTLMEG
jgi:hypothetical protein